MIAPIKMILSNTATTDLKTNMSLSKKFVFLITLILTITLSGCSILGKDSDKEEEIAKKEDPVALYSKAKDRFDRNRYSSALKLYDEFIIKFPFGDLAETARLERIFILNELNSTEEANFAINRFIEQYPLHPKIDYAYYLRGVVLFEKKPRSFIASFGGAKEISRNKDNFARSFEAFSELVEKYPSSEYVPDAIQRMTFLRNNMARFEMNIANYYADRNAHIAAIKRAQFVIENFDQAPAVIDALNLMITSYEEIGLEDKVTETKNLLASNYQGVEGTGTNVSSSNKKPWFNLPALNPFKK